VSAVLAVLSSPAFADGTGSATLTLPLLQWCAQAGPPIINTALSDGPDDTTSALCRLLAGLGDHSTTYLAENLEAPLVQAFLHLMLSLTALPGSYGIDEEDSERTLGFWYLLQESLWAVEFPPESEATREKEMWAFAKAVYAELVAALRTKVRWPPPPTGWAKGARIPSYLRCPKGRNGWSLQIRLKDSRCTSIGISSFTTLVADRAHTRRYRRDVGDTLINA
jgi:hypothetical protein